MVKNYALMFILDILKNKKCLVFVVLNKIMVYNKSVGSFKEKSKIKYERKKK